MLSLDKKSGKHIAYSSSNTTSDEYTDPRHTQDLRPRPTSSVDYKCLLLIALRVIRWRKWQGKNTG